MQELVKKEENDNLFMNKFIHSLRSGTAIALCLSIVIAPTSRVWASKTLITQGLVEEEKAAASYAALGINCFYGRGVEQDKKRALGFLLKAKKLGFLLKAEELGHKSGEIFYALGVKKNTGDDGGSADAEALTYFLEAEKCNHYESGELFYKIGVIYNKGAKKVPKDHKKANEYFRKGIKVKHAASSAALGINCFYGRGVEQDKKQALGYFLEAEELGHKSGENVPKALSSSSLEATGEIFYALGWLYNNGEGGAQQNYYKANKYFKRGCAEGNAASSAALGINYYFGHGVNQDRRWARYYLEERADDLLERANFHLERAKDKYPEEGEMLAPWGEMLAPWGEKFVLLGRMYGNGEGVNQDCAKENRYYEKARALQHAQASRFLGLTYYYGRGVAVDKKRACELFEEAEARGHEEGEMFTLLGRIYSNGEGGKRDHTKANRYHEKANSYYEKVNSHYEKARDLEDAEASMLLGLNYYYGRGLAVDKKKARELFEEAKVRGHEDAQMSVLMGLIYEKGEGIEQNFAEAKYYYQEARGLQYAEAFKLLGNLYYYGRGVDVDKRKAREFFEVAEARGHEDRQMFDHLALIYAKGEGAKQDYDKANSYYEKSRNLKRAGASVLLGLNYYCRRGWAEDKQKERKLLEEAEKRGQKDGKILNALGDKYYRSQDYQQAKSYFEEGRNKGNATSIRNLGLCYFEGKGVEKDLSKARELFEEAAEKGHKSGEMFYALGRLYNYGQGGAQQSYYKANEYFKEGINRGYFASYVDLGLNYFYGYGVPQDYKKALKYLEKAKTNGWESGEMFYALGWLYNYGQGGAQIDLAKARDYFQNGNNNGYAASYVDLGLNYFFGWVGF
ncbi:MAG: hypothetical protein BGO67_09985 [Alphaproteobacteria bacterium 41-28]|nr:MAG: hypothetical protein BGO67_09985 [Alphaproteobacteria bacterium 41-28]